MAARLVLAISDSIRSVRDTRARVRCGSAIDFLVREREYRRFNSAVTDDDLII